MAWTVLHGAITATGWWSQDINSVWVYLPVVTMTGVAFDENGDVVVDTNGYTITINPTTPLTSTMRSPADYMTALQAVADSNLANLYATAQTTSVYTTGTQFFRIDLP